MRQLFFLREENLLPEIVSLPASSVKPSRQYFMRLASKAVPCYSLITKVGLEKTKNAQGIVYSKATFTSGGRLNPEHTARVKEYAAMLQPFLESAPSAPSATDVHNTDGEVIRQHRFGAAPHAAPQTSDGEHIAGGNRGSQPHPPRTNPDGCVKLLSGEALRAASQGEVTHLPLDPSGMAPVAAGSGRFIEDLLFSTALWNSFRPQGGNSAEGGHLAADNADGVEEGQPVGILIGSQRRFVHEAAHGEMRHQ